jgi:hypothetical protein
MTLPTVLAKSAGVLIAGAVTISGEVFFGAFLSSSQPRVWWLTVLISLTFCADRRATQTHHRTFEPVRLPVRLMKREQGGVSCTQDDIGSTMTQ